MRIHRFAIIVVLLLTSFTVQHTTHAQNSCEAVVEEALEFVGNNCASLGRNRVCYGFRNIQATFFEDFSEAFFSQPSDRTDVVALRSITTRPLDVETNEWGIAVMKLQADIPNTLPGQSTTFLLLGNTQIEDATEGTAPAAGDTLTTVLTRGITLRKAPSASAGGVGNFPGGTEVILDAVSADGGWARATVNGIAGWVETAAIADADLGVLAVYNPEAFTPMQSVYFTTGIGQPSCNDAPDLLAVQGPQDFAVNLRVNGADIQLGSTAVFQTPADGTMRISVLDGEVIVNPGTPNAQVIPPGFQATAPLSAPQAVGVEPGVQNRVIAGGWSAPEPIPPEVRQQFLVLERFQPDIVNYAIDVPESQVVAAAPTLPPPPECEIDPSLTVEYMVQPGDTLTSIAEQFNTTVNTLALGNCLDNPDIIQVGLPIFVPPGVTVATSTPTPLSPGEPTATPTPIPPPADDDDDDDGNNPPPPSPVAALNIVNGDDQTIGLYQTFPQVLSVEALDASSNPLPDIDVTFTVTSGNAAFSGAASITATTDANGIATALPLTHTSCPAGSVTVEASVPGTSVTPVSFTGNVTNTLTVTNGGDSGAGSLRQAVADICDGGIITIDASVPTVTFTSGTIFFIKSVEIDGSAVDGGVLVDLGSNGLRAFFNNPPHTLTLRSVKIDNPTGDFTGSDGGLIYNAGALVLDEVELTGGNASFGGAIYNAAGTLTISNSFFADNFAQTGGAIRTVDGTVTVSNSTFENNQASTSGGAVNTTNSTVLFNGVSFISNTGNGEVAFATTITPSITFTDSFIDGSFDFPDCAGGSAGTFVDEGGNLGGDDTCFPQS